MVGRLTDKVAIVTGASSGIGEATALALVAEGAQVVISARRADRLAALAARITQMGGEAVVVAADMTDEGQARALVQRAVDAHGTVDMLINNAGVMLVAPVVSANTDEWRQMVDLNLLGMMYAAQAVLPLMQSQRGGHIVNVASAAGRTAFATFSAYSATKFGVVGFSEALRQEVHRDGVRVTVIEPGVVSTELWEHSTHPEGRGVADGFIQAMERPLTADDVAEAIRYAVTQPAHVNVNEIYLLPTEQ